ncbi:MAG: DUF3786 domain-containing protein [Dehalococcoidia bacterium]|nr:DUF3786 domain-containing protein [Dehalococcoidia bacterium]
MKEALREALKRFPELSPYVAAAKSGTEYDQGRFIVAFFGRRFQVTYPQGEVQEVGFSPPLPLWLQVTTLHYLITADGAQLADQWIAFRDLPGGHILLGNFEMNTLAPLTAALGHDPEGFRQAAQALDGYPMGLGDASFRFLAFPRLPMACILWTGEEGLPPAVNIVYDGGAPHYLHTEDLAAVAEYLSQALRHGPRLDR